jgi:DNA-binding transcriptional ArsR family regulator
MSSTAELLLHPIRLRILQALLGNRRLTTGELSVELPDVPTATLYRQVATLVEAGVLVVVEERRVRATVERTYSLNVPAAEIGPEALSRMTPDDHRRAFMAFVAGLLADFDRYLEPGDVDLARDGVGYRQRALWLDENEFADLVGDLRNALNKHAANPPGPGRKRRLLTTVVMPTMR